MHTGTFGQRPAKKHKVFFCIEVAQWIYSMKPKLKASFQENRAFKYACYNGHLHVAKWLFSEFNTTHHANHYNEAFNLACTSEKLNVAEWLISNQDFMVDLEYSFIEVCSNGQLMVAKWMFPFICPNFISSISVEIDDLNLYLSFAFIKISAKRSSNGNKMLVVSRKWCSKTAEVALWLTNVTDLQQLIKH